MVLNVVNLVMAIPLLHGQKSGEMEVAVCMVVALKGCKTPRKDKLLDGACRFTPNGTRVPDTSPPMDAQPVPQAPPLPPVPPFPAFPESGQRVEQFLDGYERTKGSDQKGKLGDRQWKPNEVDQKSLKGISSHELFTK